MKEDYLWDKTGSDPEIERLEENLAVFRSRMDTPPLIVPDTAATKNGVASWFTGLRMALAGMATAAAAVAIAAVLIWYPASTGNQQANVNEVEPEPKVAQPAVTTTKDPETTPAKADNDPVAPIKPLVPTKARRHTPTTRKPTVPAATVATNNKPVLTDEEKYAYNQLMLALSITNSKLKIVRDTMTGADLDHKTNHRTDKR